MVVAYGLILPPAVLEAPRLGCLNLHASLLPRWRGAAPIQRALLAGDRETGVTIMQMDRRAWTAGRCCSSGRSRSGPRRPPRACTTPWPALGAPMMVEALAGLARRRPRAAVAQPEDGATYAAKLSRAESRLDWRRPAADLERQVRALTPWPGAQVQLPGPKGPEPVKVLSRRAVVEHAG